MERRRDFRHRLRYSLSLKCVQSRRVLGGLYTEDVSASGLSFRCDEPHGLRLGERVEVQLVARVVGAVREDHLILGARGSLSRAEGCDGAVRFDSPLAF